MKWAAVVGALIGALVATLVFAPASWLAAGLASATGGHLLLTDARGSLWRGSAAVVLSGGPNSRDALALPGRLAWRLLPRSRGLELRAQHPCCLSDQFRLMATPRFGGWALSLAPQPEALARWPAAWLTGLGAPWNTLQPAGTVRLSSPAGLRIESVQGRIAFSGAAEMQLDDAASRLSTLPAVGSYRLSITSQAQAGESAQLTLATLRGPLHLSGNGQWGGTGAGTHFRFRGLARAEPGAEADLGNLLNLIGRRQGATSILSIG